MVEADLERAEERAETGESWVLVPFDFGWISFPDCTPLELRTLINSQIEY